MYVVPSPAVQAVPVQPLQPLAPLVSKRIEHDTDYSGVIILFAVVLGMIGVMVWFYLSGRSPNPIHHVTYNIDATPEVIPPTPAPTYPIYPTYPAYPYGYPYNYPYHWHRPYPYPPYEPEPHPHPHPLPPVLPDHPVIEHPNEVVAFRR
jgi:hypothetical protein